jgi:hypothetical protein
MLSQPRHRLWLVLVALIGCLALSLRLYAISRYGFDIDEVFSLEAANSGWAHLLTTAINDKSHPPLFYALLKLWLALGPADEAWVRLLSVAFGVALVPVTAAICRLLRLSVADTALVLVLIAINGLLIYFAQHTRMFALFEFTAAVSILLFIRLTINPFSWWNLTFLTLANLLMVYSHYWGWLVVLAEAILVLLGSREIVFRFVASVFLVAFGFLPWAAAVAIAAMRQHGLSQQIEWMGSNPPGAGSYAWLFASFDGILDFAHATTIGILLFTAPIFLFFIVWLKGRDRRIWAPSSPLFWIVLIATPLLMTSAGSYLSRQDFWGARHLSITAMPYFVLIGLSLTMLPWKVVKIAFRCALLAWALIASAASLAQTDKKLHWGLIAREITARPAPVYVSNPFVALPLGYHLERTAGHEIEVSETADLPKINNRQFWFVYRNTDWRGELPQAQLRALNDTIERQVSTHTPSQQIVALLVDKEAAPAVAAPQPDQPESR